MHIILLKFGENKASAPKHMDGHNAWIANGISDNVFQCVGSLDIGGGFILAYGESDEDLQRRIDEDPFVQEGVVSAEIYKVDVKRAVSQLQYLTKAT